VIDVRRFLLVLDMDLLALDEELDLEPINYLIARQEQEPCEVVVLSLTDTFRRHRRRIASRWSWTPETRSARTPAIVSDHYSLTAVR
jgi:hypothetical protein